MRCVRPGVLCAAWLLGWSSTAAAAPVTLAFSGSVNLAAFGGPSSSTFDGSVTWESTEPPIPDLVTNEDSFNLASVAFSINGTGYTPSFSQITLSEFGLSDQVLIVLQFVPSLDLDAGPAPNVKSFAFFAQGGDPGMLTGTASLPSSLAFLDSATLLGARFFDSDVSADATGVQAGAPAAVPEPASVTLVGLGLAGVLLRRSRRRAFPRITSE